MKSIRKEAKNIDIVLCDICGKEEDEFEATAFCHVKGFDTHNSCLVSLLSRQGTK